GMGAPTEKMLGPANVIGRNYSKSAGPIQEHQGHPLKKLWASRCHQNMGNPLKNILGPAMSLVEIIPSLLGLYRSIGTPTEKMLGPADGVGRNYSKSAGPMQEHWGHPPKNSGPS
ncbi:hypothetical protein BJV77DRAFT_965292, partial [Russula vinacea]